MEPQPKAVDDGVPVMGVFLVDNQPRRARAGAARKRAAPSRPVERGGQSTEA